MRQITKIGTERKGSKILLNVNIERFFFILDSQMEGDAVNLCQKRIVIKVQKALITFFFLKVLTFD